jgi:hypothetical protein
MPISSAFRKRLVVTKYTIPPLSPQRLQYFPCGILPTRTSFVFNCSVGSLSRTNPAHGRVCRSGCRTAIAVA